MLRQILVMVVIFAGVCTSSQAQEALNIPQSSKVVFSVLNDLTLVQGQGEVQLLAKPLYIVTEDNQEHRDLLPDYCVASGIAVVLNKALNIRMKKAFCIKPDKRVLDINFDASFDSESYMKSCKADVKGCQVTLQQGEQFSITLSKPINVTPRSVYE